jgi:hypothetical protein
MSKMPFVPKQEVPRIFAVPLEYVKCHTNPRIPLMSDIIEYKHEAILDIVLFEFGVLVRLEKFGDFLIPNSNILALRPIPGIKWELNEPVAYGPAELRELCEARTTI